MVRAEVKRRAKRFQSLVGETDLLLNKPVWCSLLLRRVDRTENRGVRVDIVSRQSPVVQRRVASKENRRVKKGRGRRLGSCRQAAETAARSSANQRARKTLPLILASTSSLVPLLTIIVSLVAVLRRPRRVVRELDRRRVHSQQKNLAGAERDTARPAIPVLAQLHSGPKNSFQLNERESMWRLFSFSKLSLSSRRSLWNPAAARERDQEYTRGSQHYGIYHEPLLLLIVFHVRIIVVVHQAPLLSLTSVPVPHQLPQPLRLLGHRRVRQIRHEPLVRTPFVRPRDDRRA